MDDVANLLECDIGKIVTIDHHDGAKGASSKTVQRFKGDFFVWSGLSGLNPELSLGIKTGETTPDKEISLETLNCLGACAFGPIVVVDGHYFSNVIFQKVGDIIHRAKVRLLDRVDIATDEQDLSSGGQLSSLQS